mgnify:CR=1 FL=1
MELNEQRGKTPEEMETDEKLVNGWVGDYVEIEEREMTKEEAKTKGATEM